MRRSTLSTFGKPIASIVHIHAKTRTRWRRWLQSNHDKVRSVWLIIYHKKSQTPGISYVEAVEEALCFGWIDSKAMKRDHESYLQYFTRRKPGSKWSRINRQRAKKLIRQGLMTDAGLQMIALARKRGTWAPPDEVQGSVIPDDLRRAFRRNTTGLRYFQAFPPSSKRIILDWILNAKKPETRQARIKETVRLAANNIRANHYRQ